MFDPGEELFLRSEARLGLRYDGEKAIVLLSGGLDSYVTLAVAKARGFEVIPMTFDYCQRHQGAEFSAVLRVLVREGFHQGALYRVRLDIAKFQGSSLVDRSMAVPKDRDRREIGVGVPSTYVPARNIIFLSHALALGETVGAHHIFVGAHQLDYSGYPDCRRSFFDDFEVMASRGMKTNQWRVVTPLISLSKERIIKLGFLLGIDLSLTHSCYDPPQRGGYYTNPSNGTGWVDREWLACGRCDSCKLRREGFELAGFPDPTRYV